ncbi:hypothetical protein P8452_25569 [Trifolium repens]|nr:hypothetical protein P8452_25569 [Trifolium repens]
MSCTVLWVVSHCGLLLGITLLNISFEEQMKNDWFVALVSPVEKILLFISGSGREFSCGFCLQVLSFYEGNSASYELYRKLNISIIKNGVIHKVSWVKYRQHVLNSTAAIADVILIREGSSAMVARKYLKLNIPCIGEHCYKILTDKVLNGLTKNISSTKSHLGKNSHENVFDLLPSTTREKLLDHWLCSQELLRHFWSSYPITAQNLINKKIITRHYYLWKFYLSLRVCNLAWSKNVNELVSLKELSLIVNGVVMSYITTQAAAETLILSTGGLKKTFL